MRLRCRCWRVTPCPGLRGFICVPAASYRGKPARDQALREESLVQVLLGYLEAMQSVGGRGWAVTVPKPCPRFGAQTSRDQLFVAAGWRVTRRRLRPFPQGPPQPFSSSDGDGKRAAASARRHDNPGGCVHGASERAVAGVVAGTQSSMSSAMGSLLRRAGTSDGRPYISAGGFLSWTFVLYRTMPDRGRLSV